MKIIVLLALVATGATAASWDSVAVFHRPEKVLVQINERGTRGRLKKLMDTLGYGKSMQLVTADATFKITCGRNEEAAACLLRFLPPEGLEFAGKSVESKQALSALGLADKPAQDLEISFLNSNGDNLQLKVNAGWLEVKAAKR